MTNYNIDQDGIDGRWRVWWIGADGLIRERLFASEQRAQAWVDFIADVCETEASE